MYRPCLCGMWMPILGGMHSDEKEGLRQQRRMDRRARRGHGGEFYAHLQRLRSCTSVHLGLPSPGRHHRPQKRVQSSTGLPMLWAEEDDSRFGSWMRQITTCTRRGQNEGDTSRLISVFASKSLSQEIFRPLKVAPVPHIKDKVLVGAAKTEGNWITYSISYPARDAGIGLQSIDCSGVIWKW